MYRTIAVQALVRRAAFAAFLVLCCACTDALLADRPAQASRRVGLRRNGAANGRVGLWNRARRRKSQTGESTGLEAPSEAKWVSLFDGKSLGDWKVLEFGGDGPVEVKDGKLVLEFGEMLTGVSYKKDFPKTAYEISLEARRTEGIDFFCALTFPVDDSHCSFIVGGWAGAVVGLSCLDGQDASSNETTKYMAFDDDRWYRIRVRVHQDRIAAWIDDQQVVDVDSSDRDIDTRIEVDLCKPLGLAAWQTTAEIRNIRYRKLAE